MKKYLEHTKSLLSKFDTYDIKQISWSDNIVPRKVVLQGVFPQGVQAWTSKSISSHMCRRIMICDTWQTTGEQVRTFKDEPRRALKTTSSDEPSSLVMWRFLPYMLNRIPNAGFLSNSNLIITTAHQNLSCGLVAWVINLIEVWIYHERLSTDIYWMHDP